MYEEDVWNICKSNYDEWTIDILKFCYDFNCSMFVAMDVYSTPIGYYDFR